MVKHGLSLEEQAVLEAIIAQRSEHEGDIFEYDFTKAIKFLNSKNRFKDLVITPELHRKIVAKLTYDHVIDSDSICRLDFLNNLRASLNPNYKPIKSNQNYFWAFNTKWAYKTLQFNGKVTIQTVYNLHGGAIFIKMTRKYIKDFNNYYKKYHLVQLDFDKFSLCLRIQFDDEGWIDLEPFKDDKAPFKIACYAFDHEGKRVDREIINNELKIDVRNKSLKTQVFSDNGTIQALSNTPLLKLKSSFIEFNKTAEITLREVNKYKKILKI